MQDEQRPDKMSGDIEAMSDYIMRVHSILGGTDAMRKAGEKYLPKFQNETALDYDFRRKNAKFTNIFSDIVHNLASRPFSREVTLGEDAPDEIDALTENIDGQGNHLHVFAGQVFRSGIAYGADFILVDYPPAIDGRPRTVADERALGVRPYWVRIPFASVVSIVTQTFMGVEYITHFRFKENRIERDGFKETVIPCVREFNKTPIMGEDGRVVGFEPVTWAVWERRKSENGKDAEWQVVSEGRMTIDEIPVAPFVTGMRQGRSWVIEPPLRACVDLQVEHYQQESGLKYAKEMTCFPMLSGAGITPPTDENGNPVAVPVGPKAVLYSGRDEYGVGEWKFIEPAATSLQFLATDIKETERQLRELGFQPLTAQSGNLTVITTAVAAQKGNSAVQAWALLLKDALENALRLTALWLGMPDVELTVSVHTDFEAEVQQDKSMDQLLTMRRDGLISRSTLWAEARRRSILGPEFDADDEVEALAEEAGDDDSMDEVTDGVVRPQLDSGDEAGLLREDSRDSN